ncbi:hypothetical protein PAP_07120 [Palaeococcus pacificus DY20341]|uniref:Uncharacterized protein n=1 Tax=Palaeococcus pacificus DY20341 TaxID=1343739 RepID=A0A075LTW2_9EURY|nr:DUF530 family protein [Palaeococcus pacificus]AIF69814.1 hypothetical protein PAP_07120 [Palaeococcus pacificus DY20341]
MTTTEELISRVNLLLDDIKTNTPRLFEGSVPSIVFHLNKQLSVLEDLRHELERRVGVTAPSTYFLSRSERDPNIHWIYRKKHNRVLALERIKSAIMAHKMALGHILANYSFYDGRKEIEPKNIKDPKKVRAIKKEIVIGRLDILPHLAYSGDVLRILSQKDVVVREAFKNIKGKLRERGTLKKIGYRLEVEYFENKKLKTTRITLPEDVDIDSELRRRYGKMVRWKVLTSVKTRGVLINNHYTVDNLALAYASLNPEKALQMLAFDLFRYYVITSERDREFLALYPDIKLHIDCHYSLFDEPFRNEPFFKTGFGSMLLIRKGEIERMLSGKRSTLSTIPNYLLGAVILYGISPYNEKKVAELLGINQKELEDALWKVAISGIPLDTFGDKKKFERFMPKEEIVVEFLKALEEGEEDDRAKSKKQRGAPKKNR